MLNPALLRTLALTAAALALLVFLTGGWWSGQAQSIQLVRPDTAATASLFGNIGDETTVPGTPIGSPQKLIIRSADSFLPGVGKGGVRYVDESKLRASGEYPLQQKTVLLFRNLGTLGLLVLGLMLWGTAVYLSRRQRPNLTPVGH